MMNQVKLIVDKLNALFIKEPIIKNFSIFLCGGASEEHKDLRLNLSKKLELKKSPYHYSIYYPENYYPEKFFDEIMSDDNTIDLLSLENFLAKNVNVIVIPIQSPGTFTELGAFANNDELNNKLLIIMKPKYKKKRVL